MEDFITVTSILIHFLQVAAVHSVLNYKIAIVLEVGTGWPFDRPYTGAAVEIGKEKFQEIIGNRINVTFIEVYKKQNHRQCTTKGFGILAAKLFHDDEVNGFFGPGNFLLFYVNCMIYKL